jgi:5-hydroxyisourate hydrolase
MGQLTTHVLDISAGLPAAGIRIELHEWAPAADLAASADRPASAYLAASALLLHSTVTGTDGRCAAPLLAGAAFHCGRFAITFHVADYFRARGVNLPEPAFIEQAVIRIGIAHADQHYHVPLLVTPWSYSVYRGG